MMTDVDALFGGSAVGILPIGPQNLFSICLRVVRAFHRRKVRHQRGGVVILGQNSATQRRQQRGHQHQQAGQRRDTAVP